MIGKAHIYIYNLRPISQQFPQWQCCLWNCSNISLTLTDVSDDGPLSFFQVESSSISFVHTSLSSTAPGDHWCDVLSFVPTDSNIWSSSTLHIFQDATASHLPASLSAQLFPFSLACPGQCPGQCIHRNFLKADVIHWQAPIWASCYTFHILLAQAHRICYCDGMCDLKLVIVTSQGNPGMPDLSPVN